MLVAPLKLTLSPTLTASLLLSHSSSMRFHVHPTVDAKPTFLPLWSITARRKSEISWVCQANVHLSGFVPQIFFFWVNFLILIWFLVLSCIVFGLIIDKFYNFFFFFLVICDVECGKWKHGSCDPFLAYHALMKMAWLWFAILWFLMWSLEFFYLFF